MAQKMLDSGNAKKNRKNPNSPARFIGKMAVTKDGEVADIKKYLDEGKIAEEVQYDGLYTICTDLLDDEICGFRTDYLRLFATIYNYCVDNGFIICL